MRAALGRIWLVVLLAAGVAGGAAASELPEPGLQSYTRVPAGREVKRPALTTKTTIPAGRSIYRFIDSEGNRDKPLQVHVYRPAGWNPTGPDPVLFVMHGMSRNADDYCRIWEPYAKKLRALLIVPQFDELYYPSGTTYNLGYMFGTSQVSLNDIRDFKKLHNLLRTAMQAEVPSPTRRIWQKLPHSARQVIRRTVTTSALATHEKSVILNGLNAVVQDPEFFDAESFRSIIVPTSVRQVVDEPELHAGRVWQANRWLLEKALDGVVARAELRFRSERYWTFSAVEHLFDVIRRCTKSRRAGYWLYGHSAGAQFVHRFVLFKPDARCEFAIAANAGTYTLPVFDEPFYSGLDQVAGYSPRDLKRAFGKRMLILAGSEDTQRDPGLSTTRTAMRQGKNRLARARTFIEASRTQAKAMKMELSWSLEVVEGIGHSNQAMSRPAAERFAALEKTKEER